MEFSPNETQRELAALTRTLLAGRFTPERLAEVESAGDRFDAALWADLARAGILAAALPESLGGVGLGLLEQCSVLTEIGRAVAPAPYLASIVLGASTLARFGTPDQQRRWAAPAGRGELILTAALTEEDGDDPRDPTARAERVARERGRSQEMAADRHEDGGACRAAGRPVPGSGRHGGRRHRVRRRPGRPRCDARGPAAGGRRHRGPSRAGRRRAARRPGARLPGGRGGDHPLAGVTRDRGPVCPAAGHRGAGPGADLPVRAEPGAVRAADRVLPGRGPAARRCVHRRRGASG